MTPLRLRADGELVHARHEIRPGKRHGRLPEKGIHHRFAGIGRRVVVKQEAHTDIPQGRKRVRGRGGEELKRHAGGIVRDAVEVGILLWELGEAEEGKEAAVGAELDGEFWFGRGAFGGDGVVEGLDDLGGDGGAGDGADGVGGVVGKGEFVDVGKGPGLREGGVWEKGGGNRGVVDGGNVEEIKD